MENITYQTNEQLWKIESAAASAGYKKTDDCYWAQIFRNEETGHEFSTSREENSTNDPAADLNAMLNPTEEVPAEEPVDPAAMENMAYKSFSAFDGIVIHGIEYGAGFSFEDKIVFSYQVNGETVGRIHKCTIYNNASGAAYFRFRGRREYLRDYMKF